MPLSMFSIIGMTANKMLRPAAVLALLSPGCSPAEPPAPPQAPPNILLCISDDQSWLHTGAGGDPVVKTPAFDRIAREGVLFTHAFADSPSCMPSRSAILTGQHVWRLKEGGNLHSTLPGEFQVYPELLEKSGYAIGHTSKGWAPGKLEPGGRTVNPAGPRFKDLATFLETLPPGQPFAFWLGSSDPHRPFAKDAGVASGKRLQDVQVPPHLPDNDVVRGDFLDYYMEIERFDRKVGSALELLQEEGRLQNTLVVVTSDHGMPFPRAKASLYDYGSRAPLALRWPGKIPPNRVVGDLVTLSDLAPTFLEAAGLVPPSDMTGRSLMQTLLATESGQLDPGRDKAFFAMERHDGARKGGKGYPSRALRTQDFLYVRNFTPERWPSGDPDARNCARALPYGEVDPSPTKTFLMENAGQDSVREFFQLAFAKRPSEELYDLRVDPGQLKNVAAQAGYLEETKGLRQRLMQYLASTGDPRVLGKPAPWDYYPYYGRIQTPGWKVDEPPDSAR